MYYKYQQVKKLVKQYFVFNCILKCFTKVFTKIITGLSEFPIHKMKAISTPGLSRRDALAISMLVMTQLIFMTWLLKAHLMMEWSSQLKCMVIYEHFPLFRDDKKT